MAPPNYILDPRYETIGCAVRLEGEERSTFIDGPNLPAYLAKLDPATTTTIAFNALFDSCILAWRYNFVPARIMCTMRMAVALRGHLLQRHSLAEVGRSLGVGEKGDAIVNARGKRRADMVGDPVFWRAYQAYACNDNDMSRAIFHKLIGEFPAAERRVMDRVLRCAVVPRFVVDTGMLRDHLVELKEAQAQLLIDAGAGTTMDAPDRADRLEEFAVTLRSNAKFEKVLKAKGVEIEYKQSTTDPERQIPAFAKTDPFMAELQNSDDVELQALAAARLGLRSTIEETRGQRLLSIAELPWPGYCDGNLPVPLKYAAAHTHRLGGDWSINMQNLPSGRGGKISKLRKSLCAPPGYKVVVADKSQIEARITAYLCWQQNLLDLFAQRLDPYAHMASLVFGYDVNKIDHPAERFIGKTAVLGLGYGCGPTRFFNMVLSSARSLGVDFGELDWTERMADRVVKVYRLANANIVRSWKQLDAVVAMTWSTGIPALQKLGPVLIGKGYVEGPGGLCMRYGDPRFDAEEQEYKFSYGSRVHKLYGAKLLENIVQFLARINTMHDALRISDRGFPFALTSHDELAFIVPDNRVQECMEVALEEMCRAPSWAPDIPLDAEVSFGQSYGSAKK
jgi:DNA polymerase